MYEYNFHAFTYLQVQTENRAREYPRRSAFYSSSYSDNRQPETKYRRAQGYVMPCTETKRTEKNESKISA